MRQLFQARSVLVALALGLLSCAAASAAPITLIFTGTLSVVDAVLSPTFSLGQAWSMTMVFDSATPPFFDNGVVAQYAGSSASANVTAGAYVATIDPLAAGKPGSLSVQNGDNVFGDALSVSALALVGAKVGGKMPGWASVFLFDLPGTAISDLSLPTSIDLTKFSSGGIFSIEFGDICNYDPGPNNNFPTAGCNFPASVGGTVDSVTVNAGGSIPEPGTLVLLGLGILGIGASRRRTA